MEYAPSIPRRWAVEIDGIRWLPRLIDKVRMREDGRLGSYLVGHSPVDSAMFERGGLTTEEFAAIVRASPDDESVLAALRARGWNEARVRKWSERFPQTYRMYIPLWDLDEGYIRPNALQKFAIGIFRCIEEPAMELVRRVRRAP